MPRIGPNTAPDLQEFTRSIDRGLAPFLKTLSGFVAIHEQNTRSPVGNLSERKDS